MNAPLSPADVRHIDHVCDRFEADWRAGRRPDPTAFLGLADGPRRAALLRQLLLLDWEYRRATGESPSAADYRGRFPADASVVEGVESEMSAKAVSTITDAPGKPPPAGDPAAAPPVAPRYELLEAVGHGGIGVVYRGRDHQLGREVAVKVLRDEYRDQAEPVRRFVNEGRVGSRLQHPAIVPVYDQGWFADRRPYLIMRLVRGQTLAALLKERPASGHDLPRFLAVYEQVCQAVAYAHAQGVIHRDLKPANVMVGAFGEVQVMDWGFARELRNAEVGTRNEGNELSTPPARSPHSTVAGTVMGTPAYMAPEQARGEAATDPRADVFALGAILCELLTGRPPYTAPTADELCGQAAAGDLTDARARLEACGADAELRALARRCLDRNRDDRPADAGEVARRMADYLRSAEERARRAEVERAEAEGKVRAERRARRWLVALAAALLVGAVIAVWQAVAADHARRDAETAAAGESKAKGAAETRAAESRAVLAFVQTRILAAARPKGRDGGLGPDVSLRAALESALPSVEANFAGQPLVEARVRMTLGQSFWFLGDAATADPQFRAARTIFDRELGPDHPDTLQCANDVANCHASLGRPADALALHADVLARRTAVLGPDHPDTLMSQNNVAASQYALRQFDVGIKLFADVLARRTAVLGPDHPDTLTSMQAVADGHYFLGDPVEAVRLHEKVLDARRQTLQDGHPDTLGSMHNLANCYAAVGRADDALRLRRQTLKLRQEVLGPTNPDTIQSMSTLALSLSDRGQYRDALELGRKVLELQTATLPKNHPDTFSGMNNLAMIYTALGQYGEALKLHEAVLAWRKESLPAGHTDTLRSYGNVAVNLIRLDRGADAVPVIDECVRLSAGKVAPPGMVPALVNMRLRHFVTRTDAAGCRATAELWESLNRADADGLYTAARFRAVTARVIRATDSTAADAEADRAMAWLEQAVAVGFKDVEKLNGDKDLDPLRGRAAFHRLAARLSADR